MKPRAIEKTLSANDTSDTGTHQAGILIPKTGGALAFFPDLDASVKNPRAVIDVVDDAGGDWAFQFIYYNSKRLGLGTRNEYRLTGMTGFLRQFALKVGDTVILTRISEREIRISYRRAESHITPQGRLRLGGSGWRLLECEE